MVLNNCYERIISPENIWNAWVLYRRGKRQRSDVQDFERRLEDNLLLLRRELADGRYKPGEYRTFIVNDPKRRTISAPRIRDQIVHQAIWNVVFPFFNRRFSRAAHSCRPGFGTHSAIRTIRRIARRLGRRNRPLVLHLDVVKFFDSVPHDVLRNILRVWIACEETLQLLDLVINSYDSGRRVPHDAVDRRRGIPLGNLTSQLFCNIVFMPVDQLLIGAWPTGGYARYADDCFFFGIDQAELIGIGGAATDILAALGLSCRIRLRRYYGFEALGARFFSYGVSVRRNTRQRALHKLALAAGDFCDGYLSASKFESHSRSSTGLSFTPDRRWTNAVRETIIRANAVNN